MPQRTISLRLSDADYSRLESEAAELGLKPAVLVRSIVRTTLNRPRDGATNPRERFRAAMERVDALIAAGEVPSVDPVAAIHAVRTQRDTELAEVRDGRHA